MLLHVINKGPVLIIYSTETEMTEYDGWLQRNNVGISIILIYFLSLVSDT